IEDHANHAAQILVLGLATLHEPAEHILIFTAQQLAIAPLILFIQAWIDLLDEGYQQHVQLEHAAPALPEQAVEFRLIDHATGSFVGGRHYSGSRPLTARPTHSDSPACTLCRPAAFSQAPAMMASGFLTTTDHDRHCLFLR